MQAQTEITQDLVLIGGGHSHAIVLKLWGMQPIPGVRLTLISDGSDTPYSGMLPGHVAGMYSREECHIDLRSLCQFAGAQFYLDQAIGLDLVNQQVLCADRPPVGFDYLSIDIGSTPALPQVFDLNLIGKTVIPAKPVPQFLQWWNDLFQQLQNHSQLTLGIVGGGVGGVELALNVQQRLQPQLEQLELHLVSRSATLLPQQNPWVQQYFQQLLTQRGIQIHLQETVESFDGKVLQCRSGLSIDCDATVWVTQATAPDWLKAAGLAVDERGFVQVDETLQSISHPNVFATGDIAAMIDHPRPKAGVFAVRQGKPLFENLQAVFKGKSLTKYLPQRDYLSLIGTGDGIAVAVRGPIVLDGPWVWRWKQQIDRRFMRRFRDLKMGPGSELLAGEASIEPPPMYCAGCGAKVGSSVLSRVLERIQPMIEQRQDVLLGLDSPDDAAVLQVPQGQVLVQTIDYFPTLINDPFLFGKIAVNHSLSDLFAMGAAAHSALAMVTIPYGTASKQEETLFQLLSGAIEMLKTTNTQLVGGHTIVGEQLTFGLSCNGFADPTQLLKKSGMQVGDCLILTKPLGIGALFAAQMRQQARPDWIDRAIEVMLQSNFTASQIFLKAGATACTDVTGFGLLGHLSEMLRASQVAVRLNLDAMPILPGGKEVTQRGIVSSLYAQNQRSQTSIANLEQMATHPLFPLLFDPQTSGGLLAAVPRSELESCLQALRQVGYGQSCGIGEVMRLETNIQPIQIS
jgi:selenide, water dikinase